MFFKSPGFDDWFVMPVPLIERTTLQMKKTKIAISVVVAIGVVWTAAAWFTGKQLEKNMDQLVQKANVRLDTLSPESRLRLQLSYKDFKRGVFSSTASLVLQVKSGEADEKTKADEYIIFDEKIDHGPFPFAQLKKFHLIPSMASVHTQLVNNDAVEKLFVITKGQSIIQADTRIGYGGASVSEIQLIPLDYKELEHSIHSTGALLKLNADDKFNAIDVSVNLKNLTLATKNQLGRSVEFITDGLKIEGNSHLTPEGIRIGDQSINLQKLTIPVDSQNAFTVEGFNGKSVFNYDKGSISGDTNYSLDSFKLKNQNLGQFKLTIKLSKLDANSLKTFSDNYNAQAKEKLNAADISNDTALYQNLSNMLATNLPLLLKGEPTVSIAPFSWKNDKGESNLNLTVQFRDPNIRESAANNPGQGIQNILKTLDGKLVINTPMAAEFLTQLGKAGGLDQETATAKANKDVGIFVVMGQAFKLITSQDNDNTNLITNLQYADGQITINGDKMPIEQFVSQYFNKNIDDPEDLSE